jgi:hypothetical protein
LGSDFKDWLAMDGSVAIAIGLEGFEVVLVVKVKRKLKRKLKRRSAIMNLLTVSFFPRVGPFCYRD